MFSTGKIIRGAACGVAGMALLASLAFPVFAFQSVKIEKISAGVMTGGIRPQFLKLSHTPIVQGSPNTKEIVILGEAGFATPPTPPPYAQRLTTNSNVPAGSRIIRVELEYQVIPAFQSFISSGTIGPIEGPDPLSFAFEIPPELVAAGRLQYRLKVWRIDNGVATTTTPVTSPANSELWHNVGVQANAVEAFGVAGGRFLLRDGNPADGETSLDIPRGLLSGVTAITLDELPSNDPTIPGGLSQVYRVYRIDADKRVENASMVLSLLYPDFEYPAGQDGTVDGTTTPESKVGIAWFDGFIWRPLGGTVNAQSNLVSAKIGSFGYYAVGPFLAPSAEDRRPMQKIITPNGDGKNDFAEFLFAGVVDNIKIEIFDMSGHRMRTLYSAVNTQGWDGRDDSGDVVESGVYIYQYKFEGKMVSGLVAVAK